MQIPLQQQDLESQAEKSRDELQTFRNKDLWTAETKINLYQSDGEVKVGKKKESAHDLKHSSPSVNSGGDSAMA